MADKANPRYLKALVFAVERHGNQARKGTDFPYIVHPIRVAEILDRFGLGEEVVVAGMLHDTVEDAGVGYDELTKTFGERVAELVEKASEPDKSLDWQPRKEHTIARARSEDDLEALALVAADKLDNVRSLRDTLRAHDDAEKAWKNFNAGEDAQRWYYRTLAQAILDREPTNDLFQALDAEARALFPGEQCAGRAGAASPPCGAGDRCRVDCGATAGRGASGDRNARAPVPQSALRGHRVLPHLPRRSG